MIDPTSESLLTLSQAAKTQPGQPHTSTVYRWSTKGVRGIRLETVFVGGRIFTSLAALARFSAELTAAAEGELPKERTARQRKTAIDQAEQELRDEGI